MLLRIRISRSDFWVLSHDRLSDFYTLAWQCGGSPIPMLLVRLVLALAGMGIMVWSLTNGRSGVSPFWLIYLTNWGLVLVAMMTLSGLFVSANATYKTIDDDARTPWFIGLYWVIFNVTQTVAIGITVLFWTLLYDPNVIMWPSQSEFWLDVATHGLNSVLTLSELLLGRTPVRWLHVYQPLALAVAYVAFSGIYFAADGTNGQGEPFIYSVLNWEHPGPAAAVAGGSLAALLVVFTILWLLALGRNKLSTALRGTRKHHLPTTIGKS